MVGPKDIERLHQNLHAYTLQDLGKNIVEKPIKIQQHDFLVDMLMVERDSSGVRQNKLQSHLVNLLSDSCQMSYFDDFDHGPMFDMGPGMPPMVEILPPMHQEVVAHAANEDEDEEEEGDNNNDDDAPLDENDGNENNNNDNEAVLVGVGDDVPLDIPEDNNGDGNEEAHDHHNDVWDALISGDDLRIENIYGKKTLNVDDYLE